MSVRPAEPRDLPRILQLVRDLADYEQSLDQAVATQGQFETLLFPADGAPTAYGHVAEVDGVVVGIALWYLTFSTWTGTNGIWLEDLYVEPDQRGGGHGRALLAALAQTCVERGYERLEWWVLNWNEPSIGFYESLGALAQDEWTTYRLTGDALATLGG